MRNYRNILTIIIFVIGFFLESCVAVELEHPELKAFSPPEEGMNRFVVVLPHKTREEEGAYKVEIIPGKVMLTDGVNQMHLSTTVTPHPLKGWGYTYYEVSGPGLAMSTLMAPPEGTEKQEEFVSGTPLQIRYNSRLPIVIYAPDGYEIRYRIWQAGKNINIAPKG